MKKGTAMLILASLTVSICLWYLCGSGGTWRGQVVEQGTGNPVANAAVVRTWVRISATPAGAVTSYLGINEALSDHLGNFRISARYFFPGIPLLSSVVENDRIVYRPGYEFITLNNNSSVIELKKIPMTLPLRKAEYDKANSAYGTDMYSTRLYKNLVWREDEFLDKNRYSSLKRREKFVNTARVKLRNSPSMIILRPGESSDEQHIQALIAELKDEDGHYKQATHGLLLIVDRATDLLIKALRNENPRIREKVAYILSEADTTPQVLDALVSAALEESNAEALGSMTFALGKHGDPRALKALTKALNHHDAQVAAKAADALSRIKAPGALDALAEKMRDPSCKVRLSIINAIALTGDPRSAEALIDVWGDDDPEIRGAASDVLLALGVHSVDSLVGALSHENSYFRWRASWVLGELKEPKAVPMLIARLRDDVSEVRWSSIEALGLIKDPLAIEPLKALLVDDDIGIREKASETLKIFLTDVVNVQR